MTQLDAKSAEYVARSERAAAEIATWPKWMQRNLTPPRQRVPSSADPTRSRSGTAWEWSEEDVPIIATTGHLSIKETQ